MPPALRAGRAGFRAVALFFAREDFFGEDFLFAPALFAAVFLPALRLALTLDRPLLRPRLADFDRDAPLDRFFFFAIVVLLLPLTADVTRLFSANHLAYIG
jgi:hypothetical protein